MIRKATPSDIDKIVELGIESLQNDAYSHLVIAPEKVRQTAIETVSSAQHFAWVSEIDGEVIGAVIAMSCELQFFERKQCSVIMFYTAIPRDGGRLIKKMFEWYKGRPMLKYLEFTLERNMDSRIGMFLERLGMQPDLPVYNHLKGGR